MDWEKLRTYFYSNLATIFWSSFLLLGGGIFVAYYAHIEYMPDFDLKASVAITAAAAVTGLFTVIVLLVLMVFPGVFWGNTWGTGSRLQRYWTDEHGNRTLLGVTLWFGLPLVIPYVTVIAKLFFGWYSLLIPTAYFGAVLLFVFHKSGLTRFEFGKEVGMFVGTTVVASAFISFPLWLILSLSRIEETPSWFPAWLVNLLAYGFIIFVNVLASTNPKHTKPLRWYLILSAITLFVMLVILGQSYRLPVRVMEIYKFGNISATEVVLKKDACESVKALGIEVTSPSQDICVAKNFLIMSRLGKETYIQYGAEKDAVKFTVASDQIISWAIRETASQQTANKGMESTH